MVGRLRQYGLEENVKQERRKFGFKILVATESMWENIGDIIREFKYRQAYGKNIVNISC